MTSDDKSSPVRGGTSDPPPNEPESPNQPARARGPRTTSPRPLDHDDVDVVVLSPADTETIGACPICMCRSSSAVMRHCSSTFDLVLNSTNSAGGVANSGGCCRIPCSCAEGTYHVDCLAEHFRTTGGWGCPTCRQDLLLYENALRGEQMVSAVLVSLRILALPADEKELVGGV